MNDKVPVTILTGFLGSGKTTLLNRILSENHGKRIAVIENEYGEIGIDQALVIEADEEIFEMSNGCICCTVRGDLIRVLGNLAKRREKFDYVLVETTGLADPGPVAQTFFMDDEIREQFALDGIITLVDAKHVREQLGRSRESEEQIAFGDVIVLNKCDLVSAAELSALERRIRSMNRMARVHRATNAEVPIAEILDLSAFDLNRALAKRPTFLEPEYPFEWSGVYALEPGTYRLELCEGPDPSMSIALVPMTGSDDEALREAAERCVRIYAEPATVVEPGGVLTVGGGHVELALAAPGRKSFDLRIEQAGKVGLYSQHLPEEFSLELFAVDGVPLSPTTEEEERRQSARPLRPLPATPLPRIAGESVEPIADRTWVAEHEHDAEVTSVGLEAEGDVDPDLLNAWLGALLRKKGVDLFRTKGFISFPGEPRRYVFQGVHMLLNGQPGAPWGDGPRKNQLVFIGRNLDRDALREGFFACLL